MQLLTFLLFLCLILMESSWETPEQVYQGKIWIDNLWPTRKNFILRFCRSKLLLLNYIESLVFLVILTFMVTQDARIPFFMGLTIKYLTQIITSAGYYQNWFKNAIPDFVFIAVLLWYQNRRKQQQELWLSINLKFLILILYNLQSAYFTI